MDTLLVMSYFAKSKMQYGYPAHFVRHLQMGLRSAIIFSQPNSASHKMEVSFQHLNLAKRNLPRYENGGNKAILLTCNLIVIYKKVLIIGSRL